MIRALACWFDKYPLAAVWAGLLVCFVLMELMAALIKH